MICVLIVPERIIADTPLHSPETLGTHRRSWVRTRAVRGVYSLGFMTIVHPQARAGATFQALVPVSRVACDQVIVGGERLTTS